MRNKTDWLLLILACGLAAGLRAPQMLTGFDADGLPIPGRASDVLLAGVLALAAVYFVLAARKLPGKRGESGDLAESFRFSGDTGAVAGAVAGVFLVMAGAVASGAASLTTHASTGLILLAAFAVASAFGVLYAVFALYRGNSVRGVALLIPVCCLVACLICLYRTDASDPVLARIYVELLATAALTYASLERAAFAFANGSPRLYLPVSAMAAVLAVCAAAELRSLAASLLFGGCALIELGFLRTAKFEKN